MKVKKDEMYISIQLQAFKWSILIGWIAAISFFVFGAVFHVLHMELIFVPLMQTAVYWVYRLIKTEKMAEGIKDEE